MTTEDTIMARVVYNRTVLYSGLVFDDTEQIRKAQEFLCLLIRRGVVKLCDEEQIEFDFKK